MIKLYNNGVYLLNGTEIVEDTNEAGLIVKQKTGVDINAKKNTIAYNILKEHNTFKIL